MTGKNLPDENEPIDVHWVSDIFGWWHRLKGNGTYPNFLDPPILGDGWHGIGWHASKYRHNARF
jgi:hypothetical protein